MLQGGCGINLCGRGRGGELGAPFSFRDRESQRGEMEGQVRRWKGWLGEGCVLNGYVGKDWRIWRRGGGEEGRSLSTEMKRYEGYLVGTVLGPWERGFECVGCGDRW